MLFAVATKGYMEAPKKKNTKPLRRAKRREYPIAPNTELQTLIHVANLVPADTELPSFSGDEQSFGRFLDRTFPRTSFAALRSFLDDGIDHPEFPPSDAYTYMREAREALRMIATHQRERSLFYLTFHFPWEKVGDWKAERIRMCESCGLLFYAHRNNRLTCSDRCSTARRVREWRKHQSQYEQARKRRRGK
jgi:hypothetical protein